MDFHHEATVQRSSHHNQMSQYDFLKLTSTLD